MRRADEFIDETDVADGIQFAFRKIFMDGGDGVQTTLFACHTIVFQQAVQTAHHFVAFRPAGGVWIPLPQFLPIEGVAEEIRAFSVFAIPVGKHFRSIVQIFFVSRLFIEHDQRFQNGHGGDAHDLVVSSHI